MKYSLLKCVVTLAILLTAWTAEAGCRVMFPADALQRLELSKAVQNANPKAVLKDVVIAAPGLAIVSFKEGALAVQRVALAYEFRSPDCVGEDKQSMNELLSNSMLFRVLSYAPVTVTTK